MYATSFPTRIPTQLTCLLINKEEEKAPCCFSSLAAGYLSAHSLSFSRESQSDPLPPHATLTKHPKVTLANKSAKVRPAGFPKTFPIILNI
jgi:hypothetical protein